MVSSFPFFVLILRFLESPLDLGVNEGVGLENREGADLIQEEEKAEAERTTALSLYSNFLHSMAHFTVTSGTLHFPTPPLYLQCLTSDYNLISQKNRLLTSEYSALRGRRRRNGRGRGRRERRQRRGRRRRGRRRRWWVVWRRRGWRRIRRGDRAERQSEFLPSSICFSLYSIFLPLDYYVVLWGFVEIRRKVWG